MNPPPRINTPDTDLSPLLSSLSELIRHSREKALRMVDTLQVQTCWNMGRHIIEYEQAGAARAEYGKQLLPTLAKALTAEFGKGFDERNLRHMRGFYQAFPIWNAVRHSLEMPGRTSACIAGLKHQSLFQGRTLHLPCPQGFQSRIEWQ